jgi:hypothetical protein
VPSFALVLFAASLAAAPDLPVLKGTVPAPQSSCVTRLVDVNAGSGEKRFTSHYTFDRNWALDTWTAGRVTGASLWQRRDSSWCKLVGSARLDAAQMQTYGVPRAVATHFDALQPPARNAGNAH